MDPLTPIEQRELKRACDLLAQSQREQLLLTAELLRSDDTRLKRISDPLMEATAILDDMKR